MYIRGLIPRNFAELAEVVPIDTISIRSLPATLDILSTALSSAYVLNSLYCKQYGPRSGFIVFASGIKHFSAEHLNIDSRRKNQKRF